MSDLLQAAKEGYAYIHEALISHDQAYGDHPAMRWNRSQIVADLETVGKAIEQAEADTPMTGWQPIETAPKDGRKLILLLTPSMWPQIAYSNSWWRSGFSVETKPTHWMPIPTIETKHGILGEFDK